MELGYRLEFNLEFGKRARPIVFLVAGIRSRSHMFLVVSTCIILRFEDTHAHGHFVFTWHMACAHCFSTHVRNCQYTVVSTHLSVHNCQCTLVSTQLSVHTCQYTSVSTQVSVHNCQYTIVSTCCYNEANHSQYIASTFLRGLIDFLDLHDVISLLDSLGIGHWMRQ